VNGLCIAFPLQWAHNGFRCGKCGIIDDVIDSAALSTFNKNIMNIIAADDSVEIIEASGTI
jgi:hypothetical protein